MPLFTIGKKKEEKPAAGPGPMPGPPQGGGGGTPMDQVLALRQQGVPDDKIISQLQQQGLSQEEIYNAMSQADIGGTAGPAPPMGGPPPTGGPAPPGGPPPMGGPEAMPSLGGPAPPAGEAPAGVHPMGAGDRAMIEELTEAIIDEKWKELLADINKVAEWKEKTESRITKIEQIMTDIKSQFETLQKGMLGKISEYDKNLTNVGVEIKAMEKVFQKILPTFTENVNKLDRITKGTRGK